MLRPTTLRCEYRSNPLGIDARQPRLSWVLEADQRAQVQSAYQVLVADNSEDLKTGRGNVRGSGRVVSAQTVQIAYAGRPLRSEERCWWMVRVWDQDGQVSPWSEPAFWQMGLLEPSDWRGAWITTVTAAAGEQDMLPSPYLRRAFRVEQSIARATLYVTARGLYRVHLNGQQVGDAVLAPEWTDYHRRLFYDTYDVTALLQVGENAVGAILGDGWYCGYLGFEGNRGYYGRRPYLLLQLHIDCADGSRMVVATDGAWRGAAGPILSSDLYMGETYDARREARGWDRAGYDDTAWRAVEVEPRDPAVLLTAQCAEPVRVTEEITPRSIRQVRGGTSIVDVGQNLAGFARLRVEGEAGTRVQLRFGEMLNPDGTLHTENLRLARATDVYVLRGAGREVWQPHFTYHGFRYVEVTGYPGDLAPEAITCCVVRSDLPQAGAFECSDPLVNQLWRNILWGQRSNFVSVPTDCPQRDERLGWLADAQLFARTGCLNMDAAAFFTRWMLDAVDAQSSDGVFADVAPKVVFKNGLLAEGAPAWGDAGIIIPWTLYQMYGDTGVIERHYEAMSRWMACIRKANPRFLRTERLGLNEGDWVSYNAHTPRDLLATAYWAYDARLMAQMARAIGKNEDAERYEALFAAIRETFIERYVQPDGRVQGETQTGYLLALHVGLLPVERRAAAAKHLVEEIERRDGHLSTGFVGTPLLLPVLTEAGYVDVAYRLLLQETCPSWGYMIRQGATTIWERWDALAEDGTVWTPSTPTFVHPELGALEGMNSYNHFGLGSVGEWLYRYLAGIDTDPERPGFAHIIVRPRPGGPLTHARAEYRSIRGRIVSSWRIDGDTFHLQVSIPANTTATVWVPAAGEEGILESGLSVGQAEGVRPLRREEGAMVFHVGSGDYHFASTISLAQRGVHS